MKKEFKIGIFAVIVAVVSFFVLNYLRGEDIFNRENEFVAVYDNVEGLVASAPVYIKGYKAGKVSEVRYDSGKSCFFVTCSVLKSFSVPADSKMVIYGVDIMGGKGVRIDLGQDVAIAADGDTLCPCFEAGLMDGLATRIGPLLSSVKTTLDSLQVTVSGVNSMLSAENRSALCNTLVHLENTIANADEISAAVSGKSDELTELITNLSAFSSQLGGIAQKVDSTMVGVDKVVSTLNSSEIEGTIAAAKKLLDNINSPEGSVGKLFVDDSVHNSVDSLLNNIDDLLMKIKENPKKYLRISVF